MTDWDIFQGGTAMCLERKRIGINQFLSLATIWSQCSLWLFGWGKCQKTQIKCQITAAKIAFL